MQLYKDAIHLYRMIGQVLIGSKRSHRPPYRVHDKIVQPHEVSGQALTRRSPPQNESAR